MAIFSTQKILYGSASLIPAIADRIQKDFRAEGYEVTSDVLISGGYDISIAKGSTFKAILGMKTALKITLIPRNGNIHFEAGVGIWGQQAIPTIVSTLVFWPVRFTQLWGLIQQAELDDIALAIAEDVIKNSAAGQLPAETASPEGFTFCTHCGTRNVEGARFCCGCGKPL